MPIDRRDFLARAASASLFAAIPLDLSLLPHGDERSPATTRAISDTDLSWVNRLRGKSRAVFDSPSVSEGGALFRAALWRNQINEVFGTPREDVTPVVVFRHEAIPLVMDDAFWDHLGIGKDLKWKDEKTGKWTKVNPILHASEDGPAQFKEFTLPAFINSGGIVLACGLAFGQIVGQYMAERQTLSRRRRTARQGTSGARRDHPAIRLLRRAQGAGRRLQVHVGELISRSTDR